MPLEPSDFPEEVQVAFFMFSLLPDHYEGMSGTYMGKVWGGIDFMFDLYNVQNPQETFYFMKVYENYIVAHRGEIAQKKRQAEERKASASGGKKYTHNVKG